MKYLPCLWVSRINIVNIALLSKNVLQIQNKFYQNPNTMLNIFWPSSVFSENTKNWDSSSKSE